MTAVRQQYLRLKQRYPEAILLFRLGDFYEAFDEDARIASRELEITLTSREMGKGKRYPMAGIPHHALDSYLSRLIHKGYKVAICEQMAEAKAVKGILPREVVRVVTPGTVLEPSLLEGKANNYLLALAPGEIEVGLAYADVSTGEFAATQLPASSLAAELARLGPSEVLLPRDAPLKEESLPATVTRGEAGWFDPQAARGSLLQRLGAATLEGYGLEGWPLAVAACGAILRYLEETQKAVPPALSLGTYSSSSYMVLDAATRRNLELFQAGRLGLSAGSLLSALDLTKAAMGGRLLRKWLGQPLLNVAEIRERQDAVAFFHQSAGRRAQAQALLSKIGDLERLVNRAQSGLASPREVVALRQGLEAVPPLKELAADGPPGLSQELHPCSAVVELIGRALSDDPPPLGEGQAIRPGYSEELDRLRAASRDLRGYLAGLERQERERTGVKSLKVGYNRVFGYYIEVSSANLKLVPQDYIRKQTLTGAERFFTPQLKEYEASLLNAQERMAELEAELFRELCGEVAQRAGEVLETAAALARLDVAAALAEVAARHGYVRPQVDDGPAIEIKGGRHPTVERALGDFVSNDTYLCNRDAQLIVLTGPNMSGKSTYIRQVALIVLLAQIGSFVPADSAHIGVVDRIFTRVGLQDDLVTGQSTFMVEMVETANILNNATPRSLIILDEIGRGTSTYDGLSLARAVAEYIHNHPRLGAKTLFATHYHELVDLAQVLPRCRNFNVAVAEEGGKVIFLHKIVPGGSDKSYGIHVAQLAGLPRPVLHRAEEVLAGLEKGSREMAGPRLRRGRPGAAPPEQKPLLPAAHPLVEELANLDVESLTPLEAITRLYELKRKAREGA